MRICYFAKEKVKVKESDNWNHLNDEKGKGNIFLITERMALSKSKNLATQKFIATNLKIILFNYQNNYVRRSNWLRECRNFLQYYSSCLNFLYNYFDGPT